MLLSASLPTFIHVWSETVLASLTRPFSNMSTKTKHRAAVAQWGLGGRRQGGAPTRRAGDAVDSHPGDSQDEAPGACNGRSRVQARSRQKVPAAAPSLSSAVSVVDSCVFLPSSMSEVSSTALSERGGAHVLCFLSKIQWTHSQHITVKLSAA